MFPNKKDYKSDHIILDKKSYEHDLKDFSFTFIELPKFTKEIDQLCSSTEKWIYFFKHAHETSEEDLSKLIGNDTMIEKAYEELNRHRWNQNELFNYDEVEMQDKVYQGTLDQKLDEGVELERERMISVMLKNGWDDATICVGSGLSLETLRLLKQRISRKNQS
jgi:predicted transposase/invertase (TIGR01784 family)